ncbi:hypothetical protein LCGC14_2267250, partial [marine sediment metagenome]
SSDGISLDDLKVGMEVTLLDEDDEVLAEGEVIKVLSKSVKIEDDEEEIHTIKKKEIASVSELGDGTEESEEGDGETQELDWDDLEVGMEVTLLDEDDEELAEGEVEKLTKTAVIIDGDKIKKKDIETIVTSAEEEEESDGESEEESEEEPEEESEDIEVEDIEVGMDVALYDDDEEELASGEVTKVSSKSIKLTDEEDETVTVKITKIDSAIVFTGEDESEESDGESEEIEFDALEKGMEVTLLDEDDEELASGEVEKVGKNFVTIDGDKIKKKDIDTITVETSESEEEEEEEEEETSSKKDKKVSVTQLITDTICANPKLSEEKIAKKLSKQKVEVNKSTLHITYGKVQKIIDSLRAAGQIE